LDQLTIEPVWVFYLLNRKENANLDAISQCSQSAAFITESFDTNPSVQIKVTRIQHSIK